MNTVHGRTVRTAGVAAAVLVAAAASVVAALPDLNGDVRYALGCLETAGRGGVSIWDIFVSRPLAYKLLMAALDNGRVLLVGEESSGNTTNLVIRLETYVLVLPVVAVLFVGVRRVAGQRAAAGIAGATGLALIALLVVFVLDRRRAAWTTLFTAVFVALWYLLTKQFQPWEWTWLSDLANLVHSKPQGIHIADLRKLRFSIGDAAVLTPVLVVAPAAAAALIRRQTGRRRWLGLAAAVVAGGLSLAPAYGQAEWFNYHFASTVVLSAAMCGAAFALCPGFRLPLVAASALVTGVSLALLHQPAGWRLAHSGAVVWAYQIGTVILAVAAWFLAGRLNLSLPWPAGVVAICFALLPPVLPGFPYTFSTYNYTIPVARSRDAALADLGKRLGPDTPVLYLTYGSVNHAMGNPTTCRYPSPLWLQRGALIPRLRARPSYADNLRCLTEDKDARYLIVHQGWFSLPRSAPDVRALIDARFDCSPAARVPAPRQVIVCPARK